MLRLLVAWIAGGFLTLGVIVIMLSLYNPDMLGAGGPHEYILAFFLGGAAAAYADSRRPGP